MIELQTKESIFMEYNGSINKNISDWKQYSFDIPVLNERNLFEIKINTSDVVFLGTIHSY